jgi:type I restriction enzyme S subunit
MIEGLKPYAEYKESGSKWLGAVPAKWKVRNIRTLITRRSERNRSDLPLLSVAREKGVFVRSLSDKEENHNVIPEDLSNYKVARAGNLVINKMKAWQGSMGIAPCEGIVSPAYFVFDFRIANNEFGQKLLRSQPYVAHFAQASDGVRIGQWDLSIPRMRQIPVLLPDENEQAAIVRFLDHANRKINWFIRVKRKLIALLNEQKQAIIQRAVTRGLNPNVPLKPSDIPWLGDIPQHWDVLRSKYLFREIDERSKSGDETHLSMSQKLGLVPNTEIGARTLVSDNYAGAKLCQKEDLVLNRLKAHLGVFALAPQPGLVSPDYTVLRPVCKLEARYFEAVYRSPACRVVLRQRAKGIVQGFWRLYTDDFYDIRMPVPPFSEQTQIMDHLEIASEQQNTAIARTEREIALMQEYRVRLTADVVTGKLDVREVAAKLPDLPKEAESPPEADALDDEIFEEAETEESHD